MLIIQTIAVAFSMFSAIPMPHFDWTERNMRYALCAFPLVGLVCGGVCGLVDVFFLIFPCSDLIRAACICLVPVLITGGIHLDGYADTCDALASYGDREKKLAILKDPHCGSFAVIRLITYFIAYFALAGSVHFTSNVYIVWSMAFVFERCLSALAIATFPLAKNTGLAHTFATAADRARVRVVLLYFSIGTGCVLCINGGFALVAAAMLAFWRYYVVATKQFGGTTGDLAGWFLQRAELWQLAALALSQWGCLL